MSSCNAHTTAPGREEVLFQAAAALPAADRAAFLDRECAGDPALRARLEALLAAHDASDGPLPPNPEANRPTITLELSDLPDPGVGQTIGRYKLLERLGEGGCGVVYVAEQTEPVRRRVALKVIKLGMDTREVIARFEAERQALALMDHPHIAKVLDAGTTGAEGTQSQISNLKSEIPSGRPYFVMELVRGIRITEYCEQNKLSIKERLDLFIKVCQAIQHAHQKGIIHRDIKPSNILVTLHDGIPVPKVIDFGIAKATQGKLTDATVYTQLHQFIVTPAYMSPEQAEMSGLDIDTRSDIYSLGVLLYELLTGTTPFDAKELLASGIDAMRKTIREKEPLRPSTRLTQLRQRSPSKSEIRNQKPEIESDLDWIVMKCLEKDRTRRYETANGVAADILRHLTSEPVVARPPSAAYRVRKARRAVYLADMRIVQESVRGNNMSRARRLLNEHRAPSGQEDYRDWEWFHFERLAWVDHGEIIGSHPGGARHLLPSANNTFVTANWTLDHTGSSGQVQIWDGIKRRMVTGFATAGMNHIKVWHLGDIASSPQVLRGHENEIWGVAFLEDGQSLVSTGQDQSARCWDLRQPPSHEEAWSIPPGNIYATLRFRTLAAVGRELRWTTWDISHIPQTLEPRLVPSHPSSPGATVIPVPGTECRLVIPTIEPELGSGLSVFLYRGTDQSELVANFPGIRILRPEAIEYSQGTLCLHGLLHGAPQLLVWSVIEEKVAHLIPTATTNASAIAFAPNNTLVFLGNPAGGLEGVDLVSGRAEVWNGALPGTVTALAVLPDNRTVLAASRTGVLRKIDWQTRRLLQEEVPGRMASISAMSLSPTGTRFATGDEQGTARLWDVVSLREIVLLGTHPGRVGGVHFQPDGTLLSVDSKQLRIWRGG